MTEDQSTSCQKTVVSVSEMARMVGLSRARFYQLIGTAFPAPIRLEGNRPAYDRSLQEICLRVRRQNQGIDGKPILFYSKRTVVIPRQAPTRRPTRRRKPTQPKYAELIEALGQLGLEATDAEIAGALAAGFPEGADGVDEGEVIASIYRHLKRSRRRNPADKVGR